MGDEHWVFPPTVRYNGLSNSQEGYHGLEESNQTLSSRQLGFITCRFGFIETAKNATSVYRHVGCRAYQSQRREKLGFYRV